MTQNVRTIALQKSLEEVQKRIDAILENIQELESAITPKDSGFFPKPKSFFERAADAHDGAAVSELRSELSNLRELESGIMHELESTDAKTKDFSARKPLPIEPLAAAPRPRSPEELFEEAQKNRKVAEEGRKERGLQYDNPQVVYNLSSQPTGGAPAVIDGTKYGQILIDGITVGGFLKAITDKDGNPLVYEGGDRIAAHILNDKFVVRFLDDGSAEIATIENPNVVFCQITNCNEASASLLGFEVAKSREVAGLDNPTDVVLQDCEGQEFRISPEIIRSSNGPDRFLLPATAKPMEVYTFLNITKMVT